MTTCFSNESGWNCDYYSNSVSLTPRFDCCSVTLSRSDPNCENAASSRYCARSNFSVEPTCLVALMAAAKPTRDTDRPTLTAGRTPELKRSVSRKIWPSVMEMTLVGMYADTSPDQRHFHY